MAGTDTGFPHDDDSPNSLPHPDYINGKIIIISLIILVILSVVIIAFHVYARLFWRGRRTSTSWHRNLHGSHETPPTGGLDKAIVDSLPNFMYTMPPHHDGGDDVVSKEAGTGVVECAVCLNEFEDNDACRLLPKCNHSFHTKCIDMWFLSNTTCPMCRTSAQAVDSNNTHHAESSAACQDIGGHRQMPNSSPTDCLLPHQGSNNDIQSPRLTDSACMLPQEDITNRLQRSSLSSVLGGEHEQGPGLHMLLRTRSSRVDARYDMVGEEMHNIDSTRRLMRNESGRDGNSERDRSHSALFRRLHLPNWRRSVSDRFLNMRRGVQFPSNVDSHVNSRLNTDHWQVGGRSLPHIIIDVPTPQDSFRAPRSVLVGSYLRQFTTGEEPHIVSPLVQP